MLITCYLVTNGLVSGMGIAATQQSIYFVLVTVSKCTATLGFVTMAWRLDVITPLVASGGSGGSSISLSWRLRCELLTPLLHTR